MPQMMISDISGLEVFLEWWMNTAARRPRNRKDANETHCLNELVIYCVVKIKHDDKVAKQYGLKTFLIPPCDLMLEDSVGWRCLILWILSFARFDCSLISNRFYVCDGFMVVCLFIFRSFLDQKNMSIQEIPKESQAGTSKVQRLEWTFEGQVWVAQTMEIAESFRRCLLEASVWLVWWLQLQWCFLRRQSLVVPWDRSCNGLENTCNFMDAGIRNSLTKQVMEFATCNDRQPNSPLEWNYSHDTWAVVLHHVQSWGYDSLQGKPLDLPAWPVSDFFNPRSSRGIVQGRIRSPLSIKWIHCVIPCWYMVLLVGKKLTDQRHVRMMFVNWNLFIDIVCVCVHFVFPRCTQKLVLVTSIKLKCRTCQQ